MRIVSNLYFQKAVPLQPNSKVNMTSACHNFI